MLNCNSTVTMRRDAICFLELFAEGWDTGGKICDEVVCGASEILGRGWKIYTRVLVCSAQTYIPTYIYNFRNDEVEMNIKHKQTQTHRVVAEDIWNGWGLTYTLLSQRLHKRCFSQPVEALWKIILPMEMCVQCSNLYISYRIQKSYRYSRSTFSRSSTFFFGFYLKLKALHT